MNDCTTLYRKTLRREAECGADPQPEILRQAHAVRRSGAGLTPTGTADHLQLCLAVAPTFRPGGSEDPGHYCPSTFLSFSSFPSFSSNQNKKGSL